LRNATLSTVKFRSRPWISVSYRSVRSQRSLRLIPPPTGRPVCSPWTTMPLRLFTFGLRSHLPVAPSIRCGAYAGKFALLFHFRPSNRTIQSQQLTTSQGVPVVSSRPMAHQGMARQGVSYLCRVLPMPGEKRRTISPTTSTITNPPPTSPAKMRQTHIGSEPDQTCEELTTGASQKQCHHHKVDLSSPRTRALRMVRTYRTVRRR
jgi:hypothetical protein